MLRKLQAGLVLGLSFVAIPAVAQPFEDEPASDDAASDEVAEEPAPMADEPMEAPPAEAPAAEAEGSAEVSLGSAGLKASGETPSTADEQPVEAPEEFETFFKGYFRAPMALGISKRATPDAPDGPERTQLSYGPNRTVDANYWSFGYTRLQEQDWMEVFVGVRKKHVEAAIGMMGYWFQSAGFRNNDAAWTPGLAYVKLDSDVDLGELVPNVEFTVGAFWPEFGVHKMYDTPVLGRFRHVGERLKLSVPVSSELAVSLTQGFGTGRDGSSNILAPPPYQATVGAILLHYEHLQVAYDKYVNLGLHFNSEWTRDPNLFQTTQRGKAFTDAMEGRVTTIGGEVTLSIPRAGSLWIAPSMVKVKNGWALAEAGLEVMHSNSGDGLATNYLAWSGSLEDSTGTGKLLNLGFHYKNTLSEITGEPRGSLPDVSFDAFGLFTDVTLDLPEGSIINQDRIGQFKYGAAVEYQALQWLGVGLRWDEVNYNLGHPGYVFSAISPRVTFASHFLSGEKIYLQYSRYRYGEEMDLAGKWAWGLPLVPGSNIIQGGPYSGDKPDMDVVRLQAEVAF